MREKNLLAFFQKGPPKVKLTGDNYSYSLSLDQRLTVVLNKHLNVNSTKCTKCTNTNNFYLARIHLQPLCVDSLVEMMYSAVGHGLNLGPKDIFFLCGQQKILRDYIRVQISPVT